MPSASSKLLVKRGPCSDHPRCRALVRRTERRRPFFFIPWSMLPKGKARIWPTTAQGRHPGRSQGGSAGSHSSAYPTAFENSCELRVTCLCLLSMATLAGGSKVLAPRWFFLRGGSKLPVLLSLLLCRFTRAFALVPLTGEGATSPASAGLLRPPPSRVGTLAAAGHGRSLRALPPPDTPQSPPPPPFRLWFNCTRLQPLVCATSCSIWASRSAAPTRRRSHERR